MSEQNQNRYLWALGAVIAAYFGFLWLKKRKKDGTTTPPAGADLKIDSVTISPVNPVDYSTPYVVTATITNHGDEPGTMEVWMGWTMDLYPGEYRTYASDNPRQITAGPGESVTITRTGTTIAEWWDGAIWVNDHDGIDGAVSAPLIVRPS